MTGRISIGQNKPVGLINSKRPPRFLNIACVLSAILACGCKSRFSGFNVPQSPPAIQVAQTPTLQPASLTFQKTETRRFSAENCGSAKFAYSQDNMPLEHPKLAIPNRISIQRPLEKEDLYNLKAETFYGKGLRKRSIEIWETILRNNPRHLPTLNNLASAYFNERLYKKAEALYLIIIGLDLPAANYPDARFLGPMAHFKQHGAVNSAHCLRLTEYLNSDETRYRVHAKKLLAIAIDKISSVEVTANKVGSFRTQKNQNLKRIMHFWAEWCGPCLEELEELFKFRVRNPDIDYLIVSIDSRYDKTRSDNKINVIFAPYKSPKMENIQFLFDPGKRLWETFIPATDQTVITVPRTLFFFNAEQTGYIAKQVDWRNLNAAEVWTKN